MREESGGRVEKSEEAKETEEATIKMKNDVLADIPATISLTTLSVVTSHPTGRANSRSPLPPLGIIGDFLNLLNRPLRPQSPLFRLVLFFPLDGPLRLSYTWSDFTPKAASFYP